MKRTTIKKMFRLRHGLFGCHAWKCILLYGCSKPYFSIISLMIPNYSYQTPLKSQRKRKTQRRFRLKEAGAHWFYTRYWTCSLIIAASDLRSVQLDSHGDQHCPQRLHYIQIKMKRKQHSYKFLWKACQLLYFITQHFCFSN